MRVSSLVLLPAVTVCVVGLLRGQTPDTTVHENGDVQELPQLVSAPATNYRACLRDAGIRGTEGLQFVIDTTGHVEPRSVDVIQSSDPILDSLAVASTRGEVFRAGRNQGHAVRVRVQQPFHYGADGPPVAQGDSGVFDLSCVDEAPAVVKGPPIRYPESALLGGQVGEIMTTFVVDSTGHVDPSSISIAEGAGPFRAPVKVMLLSRDMTFKAGRILGRPVATRVQMPVNFHICKQQVDSTLKPTGPNVLKGITVVACPAR